MTRPVRKAIIPAAGRGTRMRPATLVVPKELLSLADRPALQIVLDEALVAGIRELAIVIRPQKELIRRYVERIAESDPRFVDVRLTWVEQAVPTGLADAILACRDFAAEDPFALLLPDNVLLSPQHRLAEMLELSTEWQSHVVGVIAVGPEQSGEYGNSGRFDWEPLRPGVVRVTGLRDKRPGRLLVAPGEEVLRTCGRYVCRPDLFAFLERYRPAGATDYDEVPAYRALAAEGRLLGHRLTQPLFDVGYPSGFLAACSYLYRQRRANGFDRD